MRSRLRPSLFKDLKITDIASTIFTAIGIAVAVYVLYQNSLTIENANQAIHMSVVPELSFEYPTDKEPDKISILNNSGVDISSLEIFSVCYLVSTEGTREILKRNQSSSLIFPYMEKVGKNEVRTISATKIMDACPILTPVDATTSRFFVLVAQYRRVPDNKRFVTFETFGGDLQDGVPIAIPAYAHRRTSSGGGDPSGLIKTLKKIEETERVFFRTGE